MVLTEKIPIAISSCLLGEEVRYNGGHTRDRQIVALDDQYQFVSLCPEVAIGLGTPRTPIRLTQHGDRIRVVNIEDASQDHTDDLASYADQVVGSHQKICGYIVKKDSPSCGMEKVKVYVENRTQPERFGTGVYAQRVMQRMPWLPVEEEGRLRDPGLCESFFLRVHILHRWHQMIDSGVTTQKLHQFHSKHKLTLMSHDQNQVRRLGKMIAEVNKSELEITAFYYLVEFMDTLKTPASVGNHVNVLQHVHGYLKKKVDDDDRGELHQSIMDYADGKVSRDVPMTLLRHHFRKQPDPFIEQSDYLSPDRKSDTRRRK